jgi:hypothetical protein
MWARSSSKGVDFNAGLCGGEIKLTRNQRRQMKKLALHVDRITNAEDAGTDVPEDLAVVIFDNVATPYVREIEAGLRAALSKEGGAA